MTDQSDLLDSPAVVMLRREVAEATAEIERLRQRYARSKRATEREVLHYTGSSVIRERDRMAAELERLTDGD